MLSKYSAFNSSLKDTDYLWDIPLFLRISFQFLIKGYVVQGFAQLFQPVLPFNSSLKDTPSFLSNTIGNGNFQFLIKGYRA